jgi:phosphoribosylanthranilate isomerase
MTRVKICGIRTLEDAQVAAEAGADFIGLVFVPGRRRRLEIDAAREIVAGFKGSLETAPKVVGLFADQPLDEVNRTINACNLDLAQLCGAESLDYCQNTAAQVIKVLHIPQGQASSASTQELADKILAHVEAGNMVTLDRLVEGLQGGTGESFNWSIAANLSRQGHNFLMAGGLSPDNVTEAVSMVRPWGVDVSSGVETGGVKDHQKIRDFIQNARRPST